MRKKAFQAAFPYTIPIFAGFWFLALAYGIYMVEAPKPAFHHRK